MTGATFLLVDDDDRLRERLGRALVERGHVVHLAADHEAALEVARAARVRRWTSTGAPAGLASRAFWISATTDCAR